MKRTSDSISNPSLALKKTLSRPLKRQVSVMSNRSQTSQFTYHPRNSVYSEIEHPDQQVPNQAWMQVPL